MQNKTLSSQLHSSYTVSFLYKRTWGCRKQYCVGYCRVVVVSSIIRVLYSPWVRYVVQFAQSGSSIFLKKQEAVFCTPNTLYSIYHTVLLHHLQYYSQQHSTVSQKYSTLQQMALQVLFMLHSFHKYFLLSLKIFQINFLS